MGMGIDEIGRLGPAVQKQIMQKLAGQHIVDVEKATSRGNKITWRIMPNGERRRFHSKKEAERYDYLYDLLQHGKIRDLRLQPRFTLVDAFVDANGDVFRALTYTADFSYLRPSESITTAEDGTITGTYKEERIVEDVKGHRERGFIDKKKLVRDKFGINVVEI